MDGNGHTDCAKSLELLSDYRAGALGESELTLIRTHLSNCEGCDGVFKDLELIVQTATLLRGDDGINFPDETVVWQRLSVTAKIVH